MTRFLATLRCDVTVQLRNGFYAVSAIVVLLMGGLIQLLPDAAGLDPGAVVPAFIAFNFVVTAFYFTAALVLLEKGEGTLQAQAVTPLRFGEYLGARALSLTLLATVESLLVVGVTFGFSFRLLPLLAGALSLGAIYALAGFISVAPHGSVNQYLPPSVLVVTFLVLPLAGLLSPWQSPLFYLHPVQPAMVLLQAAFRAAPASELIYGLIGTGCWVGLGYRWAVARYQRHVVREV